MLNLKQKIDFILISLCTCKRPEMLLMALNSVKELNLPKNIKIEILVIDNDEMQSAKSTVEIFSETCELNIHYFCETKRGIANARNRLLNEASNLGATHIAMFDDDEILDKNWLENHVNFYNTNKDVIISSGPTYNKFLSEYPNYIVKNKVFKSSTTKKTGEIRTICASGNVFFPVAVKSLKNLMFDTTYIFMGGEDGDFFSRASKEGFTIVWNNEAVNYEMVGDDRACLKWILKRLFYNGYSGALLKFKNNNKSLKKFIYFFKTCLIILFNLILTLGSILFGLTVFFNMLGLTYKNCGKVSALLKSRQMNYYENISGQ